MSSPAIADILRAGLPSYCKRFGQLSWYQKQIVQSLLQCRTPSLGGQVFGCSSCGHQASHYYSCRNRHCPQCQKGQTIQWINARESELLPVGYFHAVFTIPSELNPLVLRNKSVMYPILFRAVKETLLTLANDRKHLGASIGFIAVLHTWGQNLMDHPHIHCIVPGGGLNEQTGQWKPSKRAFLFPTGVVQKLYRGKFMHYFKKALNSGAIQFSGGLQGLASQTAQKQLLAQLYAKKWVVYLKAPFASPQAVVKYLGQYTHRVAISNKRILSLDASTGSVRFRYKDYADGNKQKTMTLPVVEFIRRFLLHVIPKGFRRIRHYGILSSRNRPVKLTVCFAFFNKTYVPAKRLSIIKAFKDLLNIDLVACPVCQHGVMTVVGSISKTTLSP